MPSSLGSQSIEPVKTMCARSGSAAVRREVVGLDAGLHDVDRRAQAFGYRRENVLPSASDTASTRSKRASARPSKRSMRCHCCVMRYFDIGLPACST